MVRGLRPGPRRLIDLAGLECRTQRVAREHEVNSQTVVSLIGRHAVVPPGELLFLLREGPEGVDKTVCKKTLQGRAFGSRRENLVGPGLRAPEIRIRRGDVEVTREHDAFVREARSMGIEPPLDPIMGMIFLPLPVIPEARIRPEGIFDVTTFSFVS